YEVFHYTRRLYSRPIDPPLEVQGAGPTFRLAVRDGVYTALVNGRKVHEQLLPADPDPWLLVRAGGRQVAGFRNLKLTGSPAVPEELDLSGPADLSGWLSQYYDEELPVVPDEQPRPFRPSAYYPPGVWQKRGAEIFGQAFRDRAGSKQESLLQYHRPLLEDGEVEAEFY